MIGLLRYTLLSLLCSVSFLINGQEEKYTVVVNLYQPVSSEESQLLEEILVNQIQFYLENALKWDGGSLQFEETIKKTLSQLDKLVETDVRFHNYEALSDFKGFSTTVKKKLENISSRTFTAEVNGTASAVDQRSAIRQKELIELIAIIKTELLVFGEKELFVSQKETFTGLTEDEKTKLISEVENFEDGDLLEPIEFTYEELKTEDNSGAFMEESSEVDLADKILNLLAENSQRLERLESELAQMQIDGGRTTGVENASSSDLTVLNQLPSELSVYFYSGSSSLTTGALLQLNEVVEILARATSIKVIITGFTDKVGSPQANLALSKKRAQAVKAFMRDSGMAEDRFVINYFGESKSKQNSNKERRVEIKFFM